MADRTAMSRGALADPTSNRDATPTAASPTPWEPSGPARLRLIPLGWVGPEVGLGVGRVQRTWTGWSGST